VLREVQYRECVLCVIKKQAGVTHFDVRELEIRGKRCYGKDSQEPSLKEELEEQK
jgi:hypothetical protein